MNPPQRSASYISSRSSSGNAAAFHEQSGRSEASLQAEKAAAAIRGPRTEGAIGEARAAEQPYEKSSPDGRSAAADFDFDFALPKRHRPQPVSRAPSAKSSLQPITPSSGSDDIPKGNVTRSSDSLALPASSPPVDSIDRPFQTRGLTLPLLRRPQHRSTPNLSSRAGRQTGGPMTYQDLGTDYTRYYNPFSDSRRSSISEKQAVTPRSGVHTPKPTTPMAAHYPANPFLTPNTSSTKVNKVTPKASTPKVNSSTQDVSYTKVNTLYDPEKNVSVIDDRLTALYEEKGMAAWPLIGDNDESDDELHMPRDDDDIRYRPKLRDHFSRDSIVSTIGLVFMILGLLFIFIALPVMSLTGVITYNSSWGTPLSWLPNTYKGEPWAFVNKNTYPFLNNIRTGLIDPDTPKSAMHKTGEFGDEYELVFSDEFNVNNRTFYEGDDPYFYAGDFWYAATQDLEWYDPDAVTTYDGTLELRLDKHPNHGLEFRSGMLNSWNHLCFKGGIFEISASLPGPAGVPGLWPGAWTMGNLGRPGYLSTTDGLWPYTYQACDVGITPNQSSPDGLSKLPGQRLPSCTCPGEDHPTPGKGRGAPEIDIIEAGSTYFPKNMSIATQSYQVAPFDVYWCPNYNFTAFPDYSLSYFNSYTGGPYQQAISATTNLNKNWYDGYQYQRYSFEYAPGEGKDAFISWKVGDQTMFMLDGRAIGPNGNIQARQISEEPMSIILNLGISNSWTWIDWNQMSFPAVMRIDYVRWYQKKGHTMVTCDPPGFETTKYIKDHMNAYTNPNFTSWDQTGHPWPKHKLNSECGVPPYSMS